MVRRILISTVAAVILIGLLTGTLAWRSYERFLSEPLALPPAGVIWEFEPGSSFRAMVSDLAGQGIVSPGWRWRLLGQLDDRPARLHAGEYLLEPGLTPLGLLEKLATGEVYLHAFTIVEGWSVRQLLAQLAEAPGIARSAEPLSFELLSAALALPTESPEGWFLPETYRYPAGTTELELLGLAHEAMVEALDAAWAARPVGLPYATPYEVLTMASIVEKETGAPEERARIAGVFVRRLELGMRLQTDPTVIYGLGADFDGDLRRRDLRSDTPWNTYTRHGLPPTPIALPGRAALEASVAPAEGTALYFVSRGDGTHVFSATLAEHEAAVDRYQRKGR